LDYRDNGGTAAYVAGTPDVASLYTSDSGLTGGAPVVYVNASNAGLASLGTLGSFSASYDLFGSASGPAGTAPYWLTYLVDPNGTTFGQLTVHESGVEIGDWNNNGQTIPAQADIQSITISTPLPAALPLFMSGLGVIGLAAWFRKRKPAIAAV
jgi:hypothetical protein